MTTIELKKALFRATGCILPYSAGWPCVTCFFGISDKLNNSDWQVVLLKRGDYSKSMLSNLPKNIEASLQKILRLAKRKK